MQKTIALVGPGVNSARRVNNGGMPRPVAIPEHRLPPHTTGGMGKATTAADATSMPTAVYVHEHPSSSANT